MLSRFLLVPLLAVSCLFSPNAFGQKKPIPDPLDQNAALAYWQAFAMMPHLSEAEKEALKEILDGKRPIDETAIKIVQQSKDALHNLHRGAKMERAAWGVAWDEGPSAMLPHISKAVDLARIAALSAHVRFNEGEHQAGIDDIIAAMTLGRHVSREGVIVLVPLLVHYAIEAISTNALAQRLPEFDAKTRGELKRRLSALPPAQTLKEAMQGEKDVFLTWLIDEVKKPNPKKRVLDFVGKIPEEEAEAFKKLDESELLPATRRMGQYYDRIIAMAKLPPDEAKRRHDQLLQEIKNNGAKDFLSRWLLPSAYQGKWAEVRHLTRLALFEAGLAVLEHGEKVLKDPVYQDPFGDGPFAYEKTDRGFVLTSDWELAPGDKRSLTFGKK